MCFVAANATVEKTCRTKQLRQRRLCNGVGCLGQNEPDRGEAMTAKKLSVFAPNTPADIQHSRLIREEALDWLERVRPGIRKFSNSDVLELTGEGGRRWLIHRMRERGLVQSDQLDTSETATAIAILFLRSNGVKFREAISAVVESIGTPTEPRPRFGGVMHRLVQVALTQTEEQVRNRLIGGAIDSLVPDSRLHSNCMLIVQQVDPRSTSVRSGTVSSVTQDDVYQLVLDRQPPSCWVLTSSRDVQFLDRDQLPTRSEVTSRHFIRLDVSSTTSEYRMFFGTIEPVVVTPKPEQLDFIGRVLDVVMSEIPKFVERHSALRFEISTLPEPGESDNMRIWLITQLLTTIYPGSLIEISELSASGADSKTLASSAVMPWEPTLWSPPKRFEMLSGYSAHVGMPLVVESVTEPWTGLIESVAPEIRYLESVGDKQQGRGGYSAVALPIRLASGDSSGALYVLLPRLDRATLDTEVRMLHVFARIIGETIERQRSENYTSEFTSNLATTDVLDPGQFRNSLITLLRRSAVNINRDGHDRTELRLPFLLLSAQGPDPESRYPENDRKLRNWLTDSLRNLEWRSFVRTHWPKNTVAFGDESFMGVLPNAGMVVALDTPLTKDELDNLRYSFGSLNDSSPPNSPVRLATWVLDVPANRIATAAEAEKLEELADEVENWAIQVASIVDDVVQSRDYAHRDGDWEGALRRVRQAIRKDSGKKNGYMHRLAAECSFSLGDWPGAFRYASAAVRFSEDEPGSGLIRALCQQGDAHLCLIEPGKAWDLYSEASERNRSHPLPHYYRGYGLIVLGRLLRAYEFEQLRAGNRDAARSDEIDGIIATLADVAIDDLTNAADLFDQWGLIAIPRLLRDLHLIPTLFGQGTAYLMSNAPGPAASRLQAARRSFPQVDHYGREFMFSKLWEQGMHTKYSQLLLEGGWPALESRLAKI